VARGRLSATTRDIYMQLECRDDERVHVLGQARRQVAHTPPAPHTSTLPLTHTLSLYCHSSLDRGHCGCMYVRVWSCACVSIFRAQARGSRSPKTERKRRRTRKIGRFKNQDARDPHKMQRFILNKLLSQKKKTLHGCRFGFHSLNLKNNFRTAAVWCVPAACSAGAVGSFSSKPLSPKGEKK